MTATPAGMTYADYLKLDQLLSAQQPLSVLHDEMLFIVIHQTKELWMKEMLHELVLAIELIGEDRFAEAYKAMARISRIQAVMTLSWDVLSTLTPVDYMKFRDVLGTSSGFQSAQFRELEYRLGLKNPAFLEHYDEGTTARARLKRALDEPSLHEAASDALARAGFDLGDRSEEALAAPGSRSTRTRTAGSSSTSWPRSWSTSTTRSRCGATSMCSRWSASSGTSVGPGARPALLICARRSTSGCSPNCGR